MAVGQVVRFKEKTVGKKQCEVCTSTITYHSISLFLFGKLVSRVLIFML